MALVRSSSSFLFFSLAFACLLCFPSFTESRDLRPPSQAKAKTWCIANILAPTPALQDDIDKICKEIDCSAIKQGGACYEPNTPLNHASVVLNLYYRAHRSQSSACYFGGSGLIAITDPSYGKCKYP